MNFEKIEMAGFKSFADKVEIRFDNGVTGIVGPNGCGKSNIADAIRWVLGEQSAKSLRGSSMTDVIFNGTQNRKSLSYCEVSLYFDNSTKIFKSSDYNEVILTRKLFRSGESEYFVNKQPSLRRDIVNLLHECGVSKDGYSIISQGKVSEILSSKPEDRRTIFEEAVGIAASKAKKVETERKLERTHENLQRIFDVTTVLGKNLEPLSRAAEKTKKFLQYSEELKYHEINNYLYKYDNASIIKDKINLRIAGLLEEMELRTEDLKKTEEAYTAHMNRLSESDVLINDLHEEILEKSLSQEKLEGETKIYQEKISFFKSEISRLSNEVDNLIDKLKNNNKTIEEKKALLVNYRIEKDNISDNVRNLNNELSKVLSAISVDESAASKAQSTLLKAAEDMADLSKNLGSLDSEKSFVTDQQRDLIDKITQLSSTRQQLDGEKSRIVAEIAKNESMKAELSAKIEALEKDISSSNNSISAIDNKMYKLNMEINSCETNKKIYASLKDSFEGYPNSVKRLMLSAKENAQINSRIKGVVAGLIKTDKRYEVAIETALGNAVQNIVTATPEDAKYLIEYLKKSEGGRVTFLPVTSVKPHMDGVDIIKALSSKGALGLATKLVNYEDYYENVIRYLLGNTLVVDTIENAVNIANKNRFSFKIVTLDGDVINPSGSMTGGSRRQNQTNLLSTDRMIEKLTADVEQKRKELSDLTIQKQKLLDSVNNMVDRLDSLNGNLQNAKESSSALSVQKTSIQGLIDANEKELESNKGFIESLTERLAEISNRFSDIQKGNQKLSEEKQAASKTAVHHQAEYEERVKRRDDILAEVNKLNVRDAEISAEISVCEQEIARLGSEIIDFENSIEKANATIVTDKSLIETFYKEIENMTISAEESSGIKVLRDKLAQLEKEKARLNTEIAQDNLKRQMLNADLKKLDDRHHEEDLAIAKVDSELEFMQRRVNEEYNETYESCVHMRDENYDITTSNEEITRLKRSISGLGNINANAIEDYQNQSQEYNDLMVQKEDLEKAESDLKEALKTIRDEMLTEFNEGFEQIRGHFKKIFKELFGGGSADLILDYDNADDPLNAGVEIVAEPPGKKLQKISLLSGGEMALTAIAILFAILRLRPMPFCVLDEIEAALDDANVERFARYLKKFSNETQFIVITHKKVTMELSDSLFGVTMEEKGVSKIVSVKLSDVNETMAD